MKFLFKAKDGGPESKVTGYWLFESKRFGSIALLKFDKGSREVFHTHAFNAVSWVLRGALLEVVKDAGYNWLVPSLKPVYTSKGRYHRVFGMTDNTWALTFRGPWEKTWKEYLPDEDKEIVLMNGRIVVKTKEKHGN